MIWVVSGREHLKIFKTWKMNENEREGLKTRRRGWNWLIDLSRVWKKTFENIQHKYYYEKSDWLIDRIWNRKLRKMKIRDWLIDLVSDLGVYWKWKWKWKWNTGLIHWLISQSLISVQTEDVHFLIFILVPLLFNQMDAWLIEEERSTCKNKYY